MADDPLRRDPVEDNRCQTLLVTPKGGQARIIGPPEDVLKVSRGLLDSQSALDLVVPQSVFVVHGHDEAALQTVARFLERLGLGAIILKEQPGIGRTIIEKFEDHAGKVGFAVVLLTPDDIAGSAAAPASEMRPRQNVLFELGYFVAKLGRGRTCLLRKGRDRDTARATVGQGLAVSAFPRYVPV
jgi:predicted nucleotide-binding protein